MFLLQIVYPDGTPVRFHAGEVVEMDLRKAIKEAILAKGVGVFRTQNHVAEDIDAGIEEALENFKASVHPSKVR
jgi:hypothetical protein